MIRVIAAFFATVFFSVIFNVNKKQIPFCGIVGASGWAIFLILGSMGGSIVLSSFFGALIVSILSNLLAIKRKNPVTTYQIAGIIPLVPGAGMYQTLLYLIQDKLDLANKYLVETIQTAGSIALAMLSVYSIMLLSTQLRHKIEASKQSTI